jgi:hypothetical protein
MATRPQVAFGESSPDCDFAPGFLPSLNKDKLELRCSPRPR